MACHPPHCWARAHEVMRIGHCGGGAARQVARPIIAAETSVDCRWGGSVIGHSILRTVLVGVIVELIPVGPVLFD